MIAASLEMSDEPVNNGVYNYQTGAMYMDVINECEQLSDCILNVTEARLETNTPS